MEDRFGYLMKQEFEEDFLEHIREAMKSRQMITVGQLHDRIVRSWGGTSDEDIDKIAE